jgi:LmbE family N-acetylglucosaminyl deacetylase
LFRLLCVTAHPDDEAGGFGGTLLRYSRQGVETYVVCLTPGQAARNRGGAQSDEELSAMRREEFQASCRLLEVKRGEVLNFRDGALDREYFQRVAGELVLRIRTIKPQVVITMGPEGAITAHPDHSMASLFAAAAFQWAGHNNRFVDQLQNGLQPHRAQKLYFSTADFSLPGRQPIAPSPVSARINVREFLATRIAAFRLHKTQSPLFDLFEKNVAKRGEYELFHLAASASPRSSQEEADLFAGVTE